MKTAESLEWFVIIPSILYGLNGSYGWKPENMSVAVALMMMKSSPLSLTAIPICKNIIIIEARTKPTGMSLSQQVNKYYWAARKVISS